MVNCIKFDSIMQVIYIDKEKEWTKDQGQILVGLIFHISSFRGISINGKLSSTRQILFHNVQVFLVRLSDLQYQMLSEGQ